ncbi:MAG TPA: response regulator [Chloroflexota bacterium]|nr:response regulator [Chloroflexota bacterium]
MAPVCIVEDDPDIRATLCLLLEDAGYAYCEAADGGAALDLLRASPQPLVVLLDLMLPVLTGIQVLEALARGPDTGRQHAYILLTAMRDVPAPELARLTKQFSVTVMQKPFDIEVVLEAVRQAATQLAWG